MRDRQRRVRSGHNFMTMAKNHMEADGRTSPGSKAANIGFEAPRLSIVALRF